MNHLLDARLLCAASFVRADAVLADVGTDHAYLPIALLADGRIRYAYAADIARGPLASAREHLAACAAELPGLEDRIRLVLTDGLCGLDHYAPAVTDITVCGMGGELIARILADAPFVRDGGIRLILQPMTMQAYLRVWLGENGFAVEAERLCRTANGKLYTVLCCRFTGDSYVPVHPILGDALLADEENGALLGAYLTEMARRLGRIVDGKRGAGEECRAESEALSCANTLLERMCNDKHKGE